MSPFLLVLLAAEPDLTVGADLGSAAMAAAVSRAVSISVSFGMPFAEGFAFELEPSIYWASAGALSIVQGTIEAKPRFYFRTLFAGSMEERTHDGLFLGGGVALAFAREDTWKVVTSVFAAGPVAEAGWRFTWARAYLEPYFGWMLLLGMRDAAFTKNHGPVAGLTIGVGL